MGLDAKVHCCCWEEGRCKPWRDAHGLVVDAESGEVVPEGGVDAADDALWARWLAWRADCCAHEDMCAASERIGSWFDVNDLRAKLLELGAERFPVLLAELPETNGGISSSDACRVMLDELDRFEAADQGRVAVLVDADSAAEIFTTAPGHWSFLAANRGWMVGFDADGITVHEDVGKPADDSDAEPELRLLARRVSQERLGDSSFAITDLGGGGRVVSQAGIRNRRLGAETPAVERFAVVERQARPDDYAFQVAALRRICRAAAAMRKPIVWC